ELGDPSQVFEAEQAGRVAIPPDRLHRISAHRHHPDNLKGTGAESLRRTLHQAPEDVPLTAAARAGATATESLQRNEALAAVIPANREVVAHCLNVDWLHIGYCLSIPAGLRSALCSALDRRPGATIGSAE